MSQQIQHRRGTASEWSTANPVLASGEFGIEIGTPYKVKLGDGVTAWNALAYLNTGGTGAVSSVNGQTGVVVINADNISTTGTTNKFTTAGDISKLAAIEPLADVTDAANVSAAGAAMKANNLSDLGSAATARTNLGLGGLAQKGSLLIKHDVYMSIGSTAVQGDFGPIWQAPRAGNVINYAIQVDNAPTTGAVTLDMNKNGTTIMTTQANRASIPIGSLRNTSGTPNVVPFVAGDLFQPQIDVLTTTDDGAIGIITIRFTWEESVS